MEKPRFPFRAVVLVTLLAHLTPSPVNSQISFHPYQQYPTGSVAQSLTMADLNLDGLNDVAVATFFNNDPANDFKILIFYQNPQHELVLTTRINAPGTWGNRRSLQAGDLNGDQRPDLVLPFGQDSLAVFYQNPDSTFGSYIKLKTGNTPDVVVIGDLNHDGKNDMAVSNWNDLFLTVFYKNTSAGFTRKDYPCPQGGWTDMEIADMNGDQLPDLLLMQGQIFAGVYIYHQTASGTLGTPEVINFSNSILDYPGGIGVGDLNQDGRTDLVATRQGNRPLSALRLFYQNSTGQMEAVDTIPAYDIPETLRIADLNCNGDNEIIVAHGGWEHISVFSPTNPGSYDDYRLFPTPYSSHYAPQAMDVGDLTGDGLPDIALACWDNGLIVLKNQSPGGPDNPIEAEQLLSSTETTSRDTTLEYQIRVLTTKDTVGQFIYTRRDTLQLQFGHVHLTVRLDSVFLHTSTSCLGVDADTVRRQSIKLLDGPVLVDTLLVGTGIDSMRLPEPPVTELPWACRIYPNPTLADVWVEFNRRALEVPGFSVEIFAADGRRVGLNAESGVWISEYLFRMDLRQLASGAYFLRIRNAEMEIGHGLIKLDN